MKFGDPRSDGSYNALQLDALSYAQTSANIGIPLDGSAPLSVDAWIRFNGLSSSATAIYKNSMFEFGNRGNAVYLFFSGFPMVLSDPSQGSLNDDSWHYICATYDGSSVRLYIDGQFNVFQGVMGSTPTSTSPVQLGTGLQGLIRYVRVYNTALSADAVLANMFGVPDPATLVAYFDFSQVPPVDRGTGSLPISLQNNAAVIKVSPALAISTNGFVRPFFDDTDVNPGGAQVDPYTVQAWIYISSAANPRQSILVNTSLEKETGIALTLQYDAGSSAYRLASQRGAGTAAQLLVSTGTVPLKTWVNVATTFDGAALSLFLNGVVDSSKQCPPIPLYSTSSDLLIGAGIVQGQPSGASTLQGYIREVDVWSRALSAAEIAKYMATPPDVDDPNLEGAYVFTSSPARNQANGHPVGLAEGAVMAGQLGPAVAHESVFIPAPRESIDPAVLLRWRNEVDFTAAIADKAAAWQAAREADAAVFTDPGEKARIRAAWDALIDRTTENPRSLPFLLTTHVHDGNYVVVCHTPLESYVAYRVSTAATSECDLWLVNCVFIIVAGALAALTGIRATLSDRAVSYIQRVLRTPRLLSLLANGEKFSAGLVFAYLSALHEYGNLRELLIMIAEVGFWAIIRVIARMIFVASGFGGAAVLADLVATAIAFGVQYSRKPNSCAPPPTVVVAAISFNYDPTGASIDALSIRKNYAKHVSVPEWVTGETLAAQSPAAYAIAMVAGKTVTIRAKFSISAPTSQTVQVRANGGGILGTIDPATVTFAGNVATAVLNLTHQTLAAGGVRVADIAWNWQYQVGAGGWLSMGTTNHRIYVILDAVTGPWVQNANQSDQQLPWTDVLDFSCVWASAATSRDAAEAAITRKINSAIGLTYDTTAGASFYTSAGQFKCTEFINFLDGKPGNPGPKVNCTDCATIVTTFANVLGCDVFASRMQPSATTYGFDCNKIQAIGYTNWAYPFNGAFSYHEVAWMGAGSYMDPLYDACLQVDSSDNPWEWTNPNLTHTPQLPLKIQFTTRGISPTLPIATPFTDSSYRERLTRNTSAGIGSCVPIGPSVNSGRRPVY
jgi:hypothetical protein